MDREEVVRALVDERFGAPPPTPPLPMSTRSGGAVTPPNEVNSKADKEAPVPCPNCPPGYDCTTGNYWTPAKVDNPTIGQALCLDDIHEADGTCCAEGRRQADEFTERLDRTVQALREPGGA